MRDAETGRRYADKLVAVARRDGSPACVLVHWKQSDNRFALVVMAQIRAKDRGVADQRRAWKLRLIRLMYDRGYDRGTVLELFRVIDWMIRLPAEAEAAFRKDLYDFETSKQMPSITTVERAGIKKGLRRGLQRGRQQGVQQGEAALLLWLLVDPGPLSPKPLIPFDPRTLLERYS